ncbi:hypothetical protein XENTR_v10003323 [Xenopus tropicalis]|uniref:sphingomyelin phosphodiesterase n=3 Tax=Xenopus tropicalis TaxID=8364 RepID=A0A8J1J2J0_XENTR|nr:sphingomyelin phosphodiesterase 5 isoform X1 [Xenopus tropicalis]KAE8637103.1 hypothetical protein XENTR_v10003323 [Xenopus tropicalis]
MISPCSHITWEVKPSQLPAPGEQGAVFLHPMSLSESPFNCPLFGLIFSLGLALLFPSYWFVDRLLSCAVATSAERSQGWALRLLRLLLGVPLYLLLFLLSLPLGILGLLLWAPLHQIRRPFCYQKTSHVPPERAIEGKGTFLFISANLCLLPDGLARFSNLGHTQRRTARICNLLALPRASKEPWGMDGKSEDSASLCSTNDVLAMVETHKEDREFPSEISVGFPEGADFLCLQEVFDGRAARKLRRLLAPSFPHILYDVGPSGPYRCGFRFFNSGLFLASRYPPLAAKYFCYPNARGEDSLAAKGLLCVKVQVGVNEEQQRIVGYINCTHLHAPEADSCVRFDQMSHLLQWVADFQSENSEAGEVAVFDVLCGDLNFDNCSADDHLEQTHHLFEAYRDPCRDCAGRDRPGALGTLLRAEHLYHEAVNTPENMKRTLQSLDERKLYLAPPLPQNPSTDVQHWTGRRIDYILYRHSTSFPPTVVDRFQFITQLAGLSDHIPIALRLSVSFAPTTSL